MNFVKLNNDITDCNAVANAEEANEKVFVRKLQNVGEVNDKDFESFVELGKPLSKIKEDDDCERFRKGHSVSVNLFEEEVKEKVLEVYKAKFKVSPKYKKSAVIFKINENKGLTEHSPSRIDDYHYSLYKEDSFNVANGIEIIEIFDLNERCK